jgi:hypothetical protein
MYYQILSPIVTKVEGDSLAEAIKMFVKVNHANQFRNLVIADQMNKYNASVEYYKNNNKNKIGISINKDTGYTVYPSNSSLQPIYKENDNGTSSDIVGMGVPLSLNPINLGSSINTISATPVVTAPGMISTTDKGVLLTPSIRFLANL